MGKGKDIGPGVVTGHVKGHRFTIDQGKIQVGNDQFLPSSDVVPMISSCLRRSEETLFSGSIQLSLHEGP